VHLVKSAAPAPQPTPSTVADQQTGGLASMMGAAGRGGGSGATGMEGMLQQNPELMSALMDSPMMQVSNQTSNQ
jgi:hypothetical protein